MALPISNRDEKQYGENYFMCVCSRGGVKFWYVYHKIKAVCGLSIFLISQVPAFVVVGDAVVINTETDTYIERYIFMLCFYDKVDN